MKVISTIAVKRGIEEENPDIAYYDIRKDGTKVESVTISAFVERVRKGDITYEYGKQLIIPYTDPVDGNTYELPFNFGTTQEFEKEDGSTFTGLGLVAEYCLPTGNIQFDAQESSNSDSRRRATGNNRWQYSNLRQWLNKSGLDWYTAQQSADAAPETPNPTTANGFLSCLPADFVDAIIPVKNSTKTHSVDGGGYDVTYDKFFPLSLSQINCKCTNASYGLNDESEGRYWEYWRNKTSTSNYISGTGSNSSSNANNGFMLKTIENHSTTSNWWLRSAYLGGSHVDWNVFAHGGVYNSYARSLLRVLPACVIG